MKPSPRRLAWPATRFPRFGAICPKRTARGLLADIRAHGVRQPALVNLDKGSVVDGWHRYQVAALAGVDCPAIDVSAWPAEEVEAAVQSANRHRRHSSRKELLEAMARQRLTGAAAPPQTVEQEAAFAGVTKRRYQQVLQATREDMGLAPPNSGGRPRTEAAADGAVEDGAVALDLERMLELQVDTIEAQARAADELAGQGRTALLLQLMECRQLWPGGGCRRRPPGSCYQSLGRGSTGPGPRLAPCPGPARPAGRRAALLCQGLTLAAFPLGPAIWLLAQSTASSRTASEARRLARSAAQVTAWCSDSVR